MRKEFLLLAVICIAAFFLFTYRITEVPPGINGDEASIGLNAALISNTGRDLQGKFLPLFVRSENSLDWKQPITVYTAAFIFEIFGVSYFNLRLVSVIFVILSALLVYFLTKELMGQRIAMVGVTLFLITPIVMIQSHLAMENIAPIPFIALWLFTLVRYTKKPSRKTLFLAGIILGTSVFSYLGMRMIAPVQGILTVFYVYYLNIKSRKKLSDLKWFLLGSMPFVLILLLSKFYYPGAVLGQYRPYNIEDYQALILPFISIFDPSFLFIKGDSTPYHSTGKHGMFLLATLPLFIFGVISIIKKPKPVLVLALASFFMAPLFFGLGSTIHRASRLLALIPFYILITSAGVQALTVIKLKKIRLVILVFSFLFISLNFIDFLMDYWYKYPQRVKSEFAKPIHRVYEELATKSKKNNIDPYTEYYLFKQYPDGEKFFKLVYFPQGLAEWYREKEVPAGSVILTDLNDIPSKNKVDIIRIGDLDYYLIFNRSN